MALHEELCAFASWCVLTNHEDTVRENAAAVAKAVAEELWPGASIEVEVFGSWKAGISLPDGDLDVTIRNVPRAETKKKLNVQIEKFGKRLEEKRFQRVEVVTSAKVPLVKYVDPAANLAVDVSFNMDTPGEMTAWIAKEMRSYAALRPLTPRALVILNHRSQGRARV